MGTLILVTAENCHEGNRVRNAHTPSILCVCLEDTEQGKAGLSSWNGQGKDIPSPGSPCPSERHGLPLRLRYHN